MEKVITYSLTDNKENSEDFYKDLSVFTDNILRQADVLLDVYVNDYYSYLKQTGKEQIRSKDEYLFELVMTGVFWRNYMPQAMKTVYLSKVILKALYWLRKKNQRLKSSIDKVRGVLATRLLADSQMKSRVEFSLSSFRSLLEWMDATGEFNEEVIRLKQWLGFFKTKRPYQIEAVLSSACSFSNKFNRIGKEMLGKYTSNVSCFHDSSLKDYSCREDYFLIGRRENEYFLNMFGAEIMNRNLKDEFRRTTRKAVLLPTCMRTQPKSGCKAKSDGKELVCMHCSSECNIGKIASQLGPKGITVYLIPHSSDFSRFLVKWKDDRQTGLIGVACVLNLMNGGYEMKRLNIPSQCVFLDYCGCKKHWDNKGFPTNLNCKRLIEIGS